MPSKDPDGKASQPKRSILEFPGVVEAFHRPPVQQDRPSQIQKDPLPPEQPPPSPEGGWPDPDEFLASSDLYSAPARFKAQQKKPSFSDNLTNSRPTKSQQSSDEPDDKEDIKEFLRQLERSRRSPSALTSKPRSSYQGNQSGRESPLFQANITAREGSERDSSSQQQNPYTLKIPPPRRAPKEKDPPDLDFREEHFGWKCGSQGSSKETVKDEVSEMDSAAEDSWEEFEDFEKSW